MNQIMKLLAVVALLVGSTINLSCNINDYCLNCAQGDGGGGHGDGDDGDADDGGNGDDGGVDDAGPCVPTGVEQCDGKDNDCNGLVDDGTLPGVGDLCPNQVGECAGGVQQCVSGQLRCDKPPLPEACDNKDNDCDTMIDEGDPGGGAICGTNTGECVAGAFRCVNGQLQCEGAIGTVGGQPELCNNRDDDCDGMFDENLTLGPCVAGDDGPAEGNTGACQLGTRQCVGGTTICVGAVFPSFEQCDTALIDQDCDGQPSNGYNLQTDPQNCGGCGNVCNLPHAFEGCRPMGAGAECYVIACEPYYFNNNGTMADGCEFNCGHPFLGNEVCNGVDDDCDGLIDGADPDMITPTGICDSDGACSTGTTLTCTGVGGWVCNYTNPNVQKDAMGNIIPETRCDSDLFPTTPEQADNDCDGRIDEGQANLGAECDNSLFGDCRSSGAYQCNSANRNGPAVCVYTDVGPGMSPTESCDGRDNDCDNIVDEGAETGNLAGQEWVNIPNTTPAVQIMKYEASRPDASATGGGTSQVFACSRQNVLPWTNLTYPQAVDACSSIGARLCSEAEWQQMCVPPTTYPVSATTATLSTATNDFRFIEAEDFYENTTRPPGGAWTKVAPPSFNGTTAMQVPDDGFSVTVAGNALAQSSRLDYRLDLSGSTNYRVWLRMRSPPAPTGGVYGTHTAPSAILNPTSHSSTEVGDLVIVTTWTRVTSGPIPGHTLQSGFTLLESQSFDDNGNNDNHGRLSVAYRVVTVAGAQPYQAFASSVGSGNWSGIAVIKNGRYNLTGITSEATSSTSSGLPDPPSVGTLNGPHLVLAIGAWHLSSGQNQNVGPPSGYTELWEITTNQNVELSMASGATANPGAFTNNPNNVNGTASVTVAIPAVDVNSNSVWVGLTAGTTPNGMNLQQVSTTADGQWMWRITPNNLQSGAAGVHTLSIYTRTDGVFVDTIAISRHTTSPTFDNSWAYQNNPRSSQITPPPPTCNVDDYDTDPVAPGDQDAILATGSLPMCFANKNATDRAYDMTGNVKEWTSARAPGQNPLRGGASNNEEPGATCKHDFTLANDTFFFPNVGFRCCR